MKKFQIPNHKSQKIQIIKTNRMWTLDYLSWSVPKGFTLLEVLLATTISIALATIAFVSFTEFNNSQAVNTAAYTVATIMQKAKSRAQTQVKPDSIVACQNAPLTGYEVKFCSVAGAGCATATLGRYELHIVCGSTGTLTESAQLPTALSFNSGTRAVFLFNTITGAAQAGSIIISGYGKTKTIQVTGTGSISVK